ncbi:hypothetical protein IWW38_006032 [Coemansia aciculifera]|uniref:Uncharacterized protein n=1 Tax=Coemansia aciculifera TaxID=417176 RepID=A0ACC1LUV4_9FUNG|nr:hypothetical protein IWW38_006032 [Coemansia aciculifera]
MPPTPARPSLIGQPVSRRRSEVQALITQANAVMSRSRSPPVDSPSSTLPRASFPLYSAPSLGGDPSISGLRAALSRQQHRLEPARSSDHRQQLRHSSSSSDTGIPRTPLSGIRPPASNQMRPAARRLLRHSGPSFAASCDDGFLTLRPVHTPDLVSRTIDPRLIERAMTPMLKTNIGIQYSSLVDLVRNSTSADDQQQQQQPSLPVLAEVSELPQSRFSPINSPERSPQLSPVAAKLSKPGFLARYRSSKPLPVSAIPLPPKPRPWEETPLPTPPPQSRALGLSNIPTLRKARSLWAMRSTPSQK